jgi:hypothetical protein
MLRNALAQDDTSFYYDAHTEMLDILYTLGIVDES